MYSKAEFWNYWDLLYIADQKITDISSYFSIDSSDARCILLSLWYSINNELISLFQSTEVQKEKASCCTTILFVVKTLQDGEVNPPSDYGRSLTGVLHTRATAVVEKYQEREDSIQSGVRTTQVKRVAFPRAKNTKKKSGNLHFYSLSFSDESSRKWEKIALFPCFLKMLSSSWRKGERE